MVTIRMTEAEASALSYAAGQTLDAPDTAKSTFTEWPSLWAAYRAREKLDAAITRRTPDLSAAKQNAREAQDYKHEGY